MSIILERSSKEEEDGSKKKEIKCQIQVVVQSIEKRKSETEKKCILFSIPSLHRIGTE